MFATCILEPYTFYSSHLFTSLLQRSVWFELTRLGKRELICLLFFTCNYVDSVRRGFLFLCVLGMGYIILL